VNCSGQKSAQGEQNVVFRGRACVSIRWDGIDAPGSLRVGRTQTGGDPLPILPNKGSTSKRTPRRRRDKKPASLLAPCQFVDPAHVLLRTARSLRRDEEDDRGSVGTERLPPRGG